MPSQLSLPSISDHLRVGKRAIVSQRRLFADDRSGSVYDLLMGTAAMAWAREASADRDKFRAIYFTTAEGDDLTTFVQQRFGIARVLDTYGQGSATFVRASAAGGAGTIYAGTQVQISSATGGATVYQVTTDTAVGATQLAVQVPIQATTYGLGTAITGGTGPVIDPLWDNSFVVTGLYCKNGTTYESAAEFRARVTQTLLDQRPGYPTLIFSTLQAAGAAQVLLFPSNYQGTDHGINCAYVGDAGFNSTQALIIACRLAVESCRVLGADLQVLGMQTTALPITLAVSLWDDPSKFDQNSLISNVASGVMQYFASMQNAFAYKIDGIRGAAMRVSQAIQNVNVISVNGVSPPVDATFSSAAFPAVLSRYLPSFNQLYSGISLSGPV